MTKAISKKHTLGRLHILVIEDSEVEKIILRHILAGSHFVQMAANATEGWAAYLEGKPDIVFLDVGLPDGNGNELAEKIKAHNPATYVVMATSNSDRENKERAVKNKVDGFNVKPVNAETINEHIDRLLTLRWRKSLRLAAL